MHRRALGRGVLACAAVVLLASCATSPAAGGDSLEPITAPSGAAPGAATEDGPRTVAMVSDSITFMSTEPLDRGLSDLGLEVLAIDAQVGRRMTVGTQGQLYSGTDVVSFIAAGDPPDVWVVALGTNDVGQYADAAAYEEQIRAVLDAIPEDAPLAWVDTWHEDRLTASQVLNGVLRTVLADRADTVVIDWSSHGDDAGVVAADGVHPTPTGTEVFGLVVTDGVRELLASL